MINARQPTERSRHILIQFFAIQDWKDAGDIVLHHIPGILNPADDLTKPLGWVLHSRHARRLMGHFTHPPSSILDPCQQRSGEGVELVKPINPAFKTLNHTRQPITEKEIWPSIEVQESTVTSKIYQDGQDYESITIK